MQVTNEQYVLAAKKLYTSEGEIEVDANAEVSRGDDDGAYVQAWVWVPNSVALHHKVEAGYCVICEHYGEDCTGTEVEAI